jgi:hypothetical protein
MAEVIVAVMGEADMVVDLKEGTAEEEWLGL